MRHINIPLFIPHMGCGNSCVFCNQNSITGLNKEVELNEVRKIILAYLETITELDEVEIAFFGGSFTGIPISKQIEYLEVANEFISKYPIKGIRISTRPDYINDNILMLLKSYGVTTIELGVQSLDDNVLVKSKRGHTIEDVIRASNLIKYFNFKLGIQLMIGLPGDDYDISIKTAKKVVSLKPDFVRIYPTLVIKNTKLAKMMDKREYVPLDLEEAVEIAADMMKIFLKANINIIRVGLQPTELLLKGDDFISGPFHPSFKYLADTKIFENLIKNIEFGNGDVKIYISEKSYSSFIGHKANNKKILNESISGSLEIIKDNSIKPYEIIILTDEKKMLLKAYEEVSHVFRKN
jgi:histone acetyltransferase (RNA polymerase elongator complex component)